MLAALIIVFREVFEAGLIVGIVMAATRAIPRHGAVDCRRRWRRRRSAPASLRCSRTRCRKPLPAPARKCSTPSVLIIAVVMLTWHNVWMARHGQELAMSFKAAGEAVATGAKSLAALAIVVARGGAARGI